MRDGRARFTSFNRLHPFYPEPEVDATQLDSRKRTKPSHEEFVARSSSQGLTLMNAQALRQRLKTREVSERKQVADVESTLHAGFWLIHQPLALILFLIFLLLGWEKELDEYDDIPISFSSLLLQTVH